MHRIKIWATDNAFEILIVVLGVGSNIHLIMPWVECVIHPNVSLDSLDIGEVGLLLIYQREHFASK